MKNAALAILILTLSLSCAVLAQEEQSQSPPEKPEQLPVAPEQPPPPEKPQPPVPPEQPEQAQDPPPEVKPVELPYKRKPVIPKPSKNFKSMAEFFRLNLNIKDALRIMAPAEMPRVGLRLVKLEKEITGYGGREGSSGVLVSSVVEGSAAEKAGLEKDDVITALDGNALKEKKSAAVKELSTMIGKLRVGQVVRFSILRDGEAKEIEATIGKRETVLMPVPGHAEIAFDQVQELSLLEKTLRDNNIFDPFLKTASQIAATAHFAEHKTKVGETELINPFRLREVTYCLRNPLNTLLVSQQVSDRLTLHFNRANHDITGLVRECAALLDARTAREERFHDNAFMPQSILESFTAGATHLNPAFEKIGDEGKKRLSELTAKVIGDTAEDDGEEDKEKEHKEQAEMLSLAAQVDYSRLANAALCVLDRLTPYNLGCMAARLSELAPVENHPGVSGDVFMYEKTSFGLVIVGGKGANIYRKPAALIVDLGGDDIYLDSAAASSPDRPYAIIIDYDGDDTYIGKTAGPCSAFCGVSLLFDFAGDDSYSGKTMCLGCAAAGVAVLADFGGDDIYRADAVCQGAAAFGVGLLLDTQPGKGAQDKDNESEGNDTYIANCLSQGLGYTKGIGAIIDTAGNDVYRACCRYPDNRAPKRSCLSLSQGFGYGMRPWEGAPGADGGIGVLVDLEGHDFYIGDYFSQGSSYWYALGVLYDAKGDDVYLAGRYSQGAGIHLSVGSLIDWSGNDRYSAYYGVSQGLGHDWAVGYLFDAAGDDSYSSNTLAQGAGHYVSLGMLVDLKGNDTYRAGKRAQGFGNVLESRNAGSLGVLLDCAGRDTYIPHKENSTTTTSSEHGLLIDK
jgi:hypothetical protein